MSVCAINSELLKKMVINGAINLKNQHKEVDALNVFPVPDGDTGTNMQMTMMSGVTEISKVEVESVIDLSKIFSRGLLMGARGNSGVILSQFFRGMYLKLKEIGKTEIDLNDFVQCLVSGYEVAYKAVMEPVEGTILTVVRESAELIEKQEVLESLEDLLEKYIDQAKKSLANTPNLLPVLKEAGVVDSGGAGFVKVIEGMLMAVKGEMLEVSTEAKPGDDSKFAYEMAIKLELKYPNRFKLDSVKPSLEALGDKISLNQNDKYLDVKMNAEFPGKVLELLQKNGEFITISIVNKNAPVVEEPAKNEAKQEHKTYGLISVCFGEGIKNTFTELGCDYIIDGGQTMNPSTEAFLKAVDAVNADNIIIIPNNSNVILAAEQAVKLCKNKHVAVLKAKTIAQGYASLMVFDTTAKFEDNVEAMQEAVNSATSGEITYAVRDTEIKGVKISNGDYMGIANGNIIVSVKEKMDAAKKLVDNTVNEDSSVVTIFYGKDINDDEASELADYIQSKNEDLEVEVINGGQDIYSYIISVE